MRVTDEGRPVGVVYMDFNKAYDKVPHRKLIQKIKMHGIHGDLAAWIQNWLVHRRQRVLVEGCFAGGRKDVEALETVQNRFTRMLPGLDGMRYKE
eukprot:g36307.t1